MELADFNPDLFLSEYWQKKPFLIRNPWTTWNNPIDPDELAGLACEKTLESRLIVGGNNGPKVEHGPLSADRFDTLGRKDWTLLVQAVDHHIPGAAALLKPFRFIPNWRIDDVMVSFAADGGGVGAHFDQYDVFLIQGLGQRRWQIGAMCDDTSALLPHGDLQLLAEFAPTEEWVLEPGDMLYVPPGIAHNGVAVGENCMTYSVGFRAPAQGELIGGWMDSLVAEMSEDRRYTDPHLRRQDNSGEITSDAIDRLHAMITERVSDRSAFEKWFGEFTSDRKYPEIDWSPDGKISAEQLRSALSAGTPLVRNPASRFSYIERQGGLALFVDGQSHDCTGEMAGFARQLCAHEITSMSTEQSEVEAVIKLVQYLVNQGSIAVEMGG